MEKKYELIQEDSITIDGFKLFRIRALKDFYVINKGELGGYVESEDCLSHNGDCWISGNAKVYNASKVIENAQIEDNAVLTDGSMASGSALIKDNAVVKHFSTVKDVTTVSGNAVIDSSTVSFNAKVTDDASVHHHTLIKGYSRISGKAKIYDAVTDGLTIISGESFIGAKHVFLHNVEIVDDAKIMTSGFYSDIRIGFDVKEFNDLAIYTDPTHHIGKVVTSKSSNQVTTWNVNGSIDDVIAAQINDEEKGKMNILLQAHSDIYGIL